MAGSTGNPALTFLVGGSTYDRIANRVRLHTLVPYSVRQSPSLTWVVEGGVVGTLPDPFLGKSIELRADEGSGDYTLFYGTCENLSPLGFGQHGWTRSYVAYGLRAVADRLVPFTSPIDGTDTITFNRTASDPDFDPSLAGMGVGDMIRYVLGAPSVATGLDAVGVGGYNSAGGFGATATASVSGGSVTVTVQTAGSGYNSSSPPTAVLIGGDGTYTSCSVTVNGSGTVTGVSVTGSTGYTVTPQVWISPLPVTTLTDLAKSAMAIIPPYPVTIQGDAVLQAIEGCLRGNLVNHHLNVGADGVIRIFDLRDAEASPTTLTLNSTNPSDPVVNVDRVSLSRSTDRCYGRVVVRGAPDIVPARFSLNDGTLEAYYAHDGLTIAQSEAQWKLTDWIDPNNNNASTAGAATFTSAISGNALSALTITYSGFGYAPSTYYNLTISGGGGSGAQARFLTNTTGAATSYQIQAGGSGYTSAPTITAPVTGGGNADTGTISTCTTTSVTVSSNTATRTWPADFWAWTTGNRYGVIYLCASSDSSINQFYAARVVSHPALTAGGTCVLQLDRTLPITTYNTYYIVGSAGGTSEVYRRYRPVNANVRASLATRFPYPQPMASPTGTGLYLTTSPTAWIVKNGQQGGSMTMGMIVDVAGGSFLLDQPSVYPYGTRSKLLLGGSNVDGVPDDIQVFAAVRRGNLQSINPADVGGVPQYTGTGNTVESLERTLVVTCPDWRDRGNQTSMDAYAADMIDSVKNVVVEGVVPLIGWYASWLTTPNLACTLAAPYSIPWSSIPLPVVECELAFRGEDGGYYTIDLRVSNRRGAVNAAIYERPSRQGWFLSGVEGVVHGFEPVHGGGPVFTEPANLAEDVAARLNPTTSAPDQWLSAWSPAGAGGEFVSLAGPMPTSSSGGAPRAHDVPEIREGQRLRDALVRLGLPVMDEDGR